MFPKYVLQALHIFGLPSLLQIRLMVTSERAFVGTQHADRRSAMQCRIAVSTLLSLFSLAAAASNAFDSAVSERRIAQQWVTGYGCHCYMAADGAMPVGKGAEAMDDIDQICMDLHAAYHCAPAGCTPWSHTYVEPADPKDSSGCAAANPDDTCANAACIAKSNFVAAATAKAAYYDPSWSPDFGGFDAETTCFNFEEAVCPEPALWVLPEMPPSDSGTTSESTNAAQVIVSAGGEIRVGAGGVLKVG